MPVRFAAAGLAGCSHASTSADPLAQQPLKRAELQPHVSQPSEVEAIDADQAEQRRVDPACPCSPEHVNRDSRIQQLEQAQIQPLHTTIGHARGFDLRHRFARPAASRSADARCTRFSSRATPPIQIARLTPPVIATASLNSCVSCPGQVTTEAPELSPVEASTAGHRETRARAKLYLASAYDRSEGLARSRLGMCASRSMIAAPLSG